MKTGINLYSNRPYEEVIEAFLESGIERTFVCIEHPEFDKAMSALKSAGIITDNFHAPYKLLNNIWTDTAAGEEYLSRLMKSVDTCVEHGVSLMVAHVSGGRPMPPINRAGLDRFDRFMWHAQKNGVAIAFESHRYIENVKFMIDRYPQAKFCLDTGHEDAFTPGIRHMQLWGKRLAATHISDNEYVCDMDMHMLPFDGHIDFELTARELAKYGYNGTLMLEVKPDNHEKYTGLSIKEYYAAAAKSVRKLAEMVDSMRKKA